MAEHFNIEITRRGTPSRSRATGRFVARTSRAGAPVSGDLSALFGPYLDEAGEAALGAALEVSQEMLGRAQEYTPVDTGTLKGSGFVEEDDTEIVIGFGGAAAEYAAEIHEIPDREFSPETQARRAAEGTGWKFLQRAVEELAGDVEAKMAEGIRARLES